VKRKVRRERQLVNSDEFDREFNLDVMLETWKIDPKTQELLGRLGSDYDENGIPYWELNEGGKE
jgi:hypothetical protein